MSKDDGKKLIVDIISDLHMAKPYLLGGDMLLCAGDLTYRGEVSEVSEMLEWLNEQDYKHIVLIAGNHDFLFEQNEDVAEKLLKLNPNITYLNDSGVTIEGFKIWGSPISPWFYDWAFNRYPGYDIQKHWNLIEKCDILMVHGPLYGILDKTIRGEHVGCAQLRRKVEEIKPALFITGHIHENFGKDTITLPSTICLNASIMDFYYKPTNKPFRVLLKRDKNGAIDVQIIEYSEGK